jgi:ABC transporter substrate binding protein (PQQ-dependent alcohol dehydrogenase system)
MQLRALLLSFIFFTGFIPLNSQATDVFNIGYLELKKDERYKKKHLVARFMGEPLGRPFAGASTALKEVKFHGTEIGVSFALEKVVAKKSADFITHVDSLYAKGVRFFVADLPATELAALAKELRDKDIVLFNISAFENTLRQQDCQANLYHTVPSHAMLADALGQYLISKKWRNVLVLEGPLDDDKQLSEAFETSAKRYGLKISEKRPFILSNDPRERAKNNVTLLTGGDHDVIYVADSQGEFARNTPYQTLKPTLIVGSEGITASAWHWSWDRHGAPQLEKRFEKANKRPMSNTDWAAWMAVKAIAGAVQATKNTDFSVLEKHLTSSENLLDTFKGNASNFRPWNNQLRQPILLNTHNWVVDRAPIKGFLHHKNNLDTLGIDERKSTCKF